MPYSAFTSCGGAGFTREPLLPRRLQLPGHCLTPNPAGSGAGTSDRTRTGQEQLMWEAGRAPPSRPSRSFTLGSTLADGDVWSQILPVMSPPQLPLSTLCFKTLLKQLSTSSVNFREKFVPKKKGHSAPGVCINLPGARLAGEGPEGVGINLGLGFLGFARSTLRAASHDFYRFLFPLAWIRAEVQDAAVLAAAGADTRGRTKSMSSGGG